MPWRARKAVVSTGALAGPVRSPNGLRIDRVNRDVRIDGHPVRLTYREFELLCYLAALPRRPVTRAELIREVCSADRPPGVSASYRTVDTHVRRLRAKLGDHARVLTTIRGRGYRFDPGPDVHYTAGARPGVTVYNVAVYGPAGWQIEHQQIPVFAQPLPVET